MPMVAAPICIFSANKRKQAEAELCQAQVKLELAKLAVHICLHIEVVFNSKQLGLLSFTEY
jgi:hypothetical protein